MYKISETPIPVQDFIRKVEDSRYNHCDDLVNSLELQVTSLIVFMEGLGYKPINFGCDDGFYKCSGFEAYNTTYLQGEKFYSIEQAVRIYNQDLLIGEYDAIFEWDTDKPVKVAGLVTMIGSLLVEANKGKFVERVKLQRVNGGQIYAQNHKVRLCYENFEQDLKGVML